MKNSADVISLFSELEQSELFGADYGHFLDFEGANPSLVYFVKDIAELLNKILLESNNISDFQTLILSKLFIAFNDIRLKIDPKRLSSFEYAFNSDNELVLYRNTDRSLINIIINENECFALSFINKDPNNPKSLSFYYEDYEDFEGLAYKFFS